MIRKFMQYSIDNITFDKNSNEMLEPLTRCRSNG